LTHVDYIYIILRQLTVANIKSEESEELDPEWKDESGTKETEGNEVIFETRLEDREMPEKWLCTSLPLVFLGLKYL